MNESDINQGIDICTQKQTAKTKQNHSSKYTGAFANTFTGPFPLTSADINDANRIHASFSRSSSRPLAGDGAVVGVGAMLAGGLRLPISWLKTVVGVFLFPASAAAGWGCCCCCCC